MHQEGPHLLYMLHSCFSVYLQITSCKCLNFTPCPADAVELAEVMGVRVEKQKIMGGDGFMVSNIFLTLTDTFILWWSLQ